MDNHGYSCLHGRIAGHRAQNRITHKYLGQGFQHRTTVQLTIQNAATESYF